MARLLALTLFASLSLSAFIPSKPVQELVLNACRDGTVEELQEACMAAGKESNGLSVNYCFVGEDGKFPWSLASVGSKRNTLFFHGASERCTFDYRYHIPTTAVIRYGKFDELKKLLSDGHPIITASPFSKKHKYNVIAEMCRTEYQINYQAMVLDQILEDFDKEQVLVNEPDWYGLTPIGQLFQSPSNGPFRAPLLLKVLLKHGANPYAKQVDHEGTTTMPIEDLFREYRDHQFFLNHMLEMILEATKVPEDLDINAIIMKHVPGSDLKIRYMLMLNMAKRTF